MSSAEQPIPTTPSEQLGDELYDLMQGSDGASVDAIQRKPRLMSLSCVRSGSPAVDAPHPTAEAIALRAREVVKEATDDLVKPPPEREPVDETDLGAAARCFLALEPGTEALGLKDRRREAALYTDKSIRAMAKTQARPYRPSHERKLMGALAAKLREREFDFLEQRGNVARPSANTPGGGPWLQVVQGVWDIAHRLSASLHICFGFFQPAPSGEYIADVDSLMLFRNLLSLINWPDDTTYVRFDLMPHQPPKMLPHQTIANLHKAAPFDSDTIRRLSHTEIGFPESPYADELLVLWRRWLDSCQCSRTQPDSPCKVHRFRSALDSYIEHLDQCWTELRDPYREPGSYGIDRSPTKILEWYCVRAIIDKSGSNGV